LALPIREKTIADPKTGAITGYSVPPKTASIGFSSSSKIQQKTQMGKDLKIRDYHWVFLGVFSLKSYLCRP
jgi:hypothetical protein